MYFPTLTLLSIIALATAAPADVYVSGTSGTYTEPHTSINTKSSRSSSGGFLSRNYAKGKFAMQRAYENHPNAIIASVLGVPIIAGTAVAIKHRRDKKKEELAEKKGTNDKTIGIDGETL